MQFQAVKAAIQATLTAQANGFFLTVGSAQRSTSSDDLQVLPVVQVYFHQTEFDPARGTNRGRKNGDVTYKVALLIAAPSQGDISTLSQNPTFSEVAQAIQNMIPANDLADAAFDQLVSDVWNILENPVNIGACFGLGPGAFSNFWISSVQKSAPVTQGEAVVIAGSADITLRLNEIPVSATPVAGNGSDTKLAAAIDQTADPKTVGFNPNVVRDPKFSTEDLGQKVGN